MKSQDSKVKGQNYMSKIKIELRRVAEEIPDYKGTQSAKVKSQSHSANVKTELKSRCYNFSVNVLRFLKSVEANRIQFPIIDHLVRAFTSVGANVVEARAASSKRDFLRFYEIALKSSNETKYWLCLLRDAFDIDKSKVDPLLQEAAEISNMIAASILTMKNKR